MAINITYDHQIFCIQRYGGISRYFIEIASRLKIDNQFNVNIVAPLHFNAYLANYSGDVFGKFLEPIPKTAKARWFLNSKLSRIYIKYNQPNILHETYYRMNPYSFNKSACVITMHDMVYEKYPHFFPNNITSKQKKLAVERADHIICVSNNTKNDLIQILGVSPEKITVVYHGSSLSPVIQKESTQKIRSKPYIFFVGRRPLYKNFKHLLHAYSLSDNLRKDFDIVCFGGERVCDEEKKVILDLCLNLNCIKFVNGNDELLAKYYRNAAVFVYPSLYEGFGIPLLESMSCSCPIACSNSSCFSEIAGEAAEFFDPSNTENIINAIHRVVYSTYRAKELVGLGEKRLKLFSWDKAATQTADVYKSIL
jgi:glycosyltransferase involved in cell wall biosynthesis